MTILAYRKFKYIYVAGPYSNGDTIVNVREAILMAEKLVKEEYTPYIPHLTAFWHILAPREVEYARNLGIPVFYSIEEIK